MFALYPMATWWNSHCQSNRSWLGWCAWAARKHPGASLSNVAWVNNPLTGWGQKRTYKRFPNSQEANKDWRVTTTTETPCPKTAAKDNPTAWFDVTKMGMMNKGVVVWFSETDRYKLDWILNPNLNIFLTSIKMCPKHRVCESGQMCLLITWSDWFCFCFALTNS